MSQPAIFSLSFLPSAGSQPTFAVEFYSPVSINGLLAEPTPHRLDASKAAVAGLVRSLCVALAPLGIRVNSMARDSCEHRSPIKSSISIKQPCNG